MARTRITGSELAKLLNALPQPVYLLDEGRRIVFANEACLQWLSAEPDEIVGQRLDYHSSAQEGLAARASGLCPPPRISEQRVTVGVVSAENPAGELRFRKATFLSLGSFDDEIAGVLAVVDDEEFGEPPEVAPGDSGEDAAEAEAFHQALRGFRNRWSARLRMDRFVGETTAIQLARRRAEAAVGQSYSVLIVGPPGSGRQRLADAIHYGNRPEAAGQRVALDCAALTGDLVFSTVAAMSAGKGWSASKEQSTLLLNHVDQLPPEAQPALHDLLAAPGFIPRKMATAAKPLLDMASDGRFHEPLAAELSTMVIELPPLAARRSDVPLLAQAFVEELNAAGGKQLGGFTGEALDRLDAYDWPGNVDQLALFVEQSHRASAGPLIGADDLPQLLRLAAQAAAYPRKSEERIVLDEFLREIERELLRRALKRSKGNKAKAARLLGLSRPRLYRRMVQLGLGE
ncbi:MAG: helix-turn-helix domain-containing protein [Planctomycetota bacterium]